MNQTDTDGRALGELGGCGPKHRHPHDVYIRTNQQPHVHHDVPLYMYAANYQQAKLYSKTYMQAINQSMHS